MNNKDNCPDCGHNKHYVIDGDSIEIPSSDRDIPPEYDPICEELECCDCGFIWIKKYNTDNE